MELEMVKWKWNAAQKDGFQLSISTRHFLSLLHSSLISVPKTQLIMRLSIASVLFLGCMSHNNILGRDKTKKQILVGCECVCMDMCVLLWMFRVFIPVPLAMASCYPFLICE